MKTAMIWGAGGGIGRNTQLTNDEWTVSKAQGLFVGIRVPSILSFGALLYSGR